MKKEIKAMLYILWRLCYQKIDGKDLDKVGHICINEETKINDLV